MIDYHIHLLHTVIHKFSGIQISSGNVAQAFEQGEPIPEESAVDISIQSTLAGSDQGMYLQTHFQVDDVRLPESDGGAGYRLQFCLFAVFAVDEVESPENVKTFAETQVANLLAPTISDHHERFVLTLLPGTPVSRLQLHIPAEVLREFITQNKISFRAID